MKRALVVAVALTLILSVAAFAGNNPAPKAAVHVMPHATRTCTKSFPVITGCADIVTTEPSPDADAFPVFFDLCECKGLEFSLTWPEWTSDAMWHSCADVSAGDIRRPGDGVAVAWYECQISPMLVPGWAWIEADDPGLVCVGPHPASGLAIVDCYGNTSEPTYNFCAGVNGAVGEDP